MCTLSLSFSSFFFSVKPFQVGCRHYDTSFLSIMHLLRKRAFCYIATVRLSCLRKLTFIPYYHQIPRPHSQFPRCLMDVYLVFKKSYYILYIALYYYSLISFMLENFPSFLFLFLSDIEFFNLIFKNCDKVHIKFNHFNHF